MPGSVPNSKEGDLLWSPSPERRAASRIADYLIWLERAKGLSFSDYPDLHAFSTRELSTFWLSIWEHFEVIAHAPAQSVLEGTLPNVRWFPGAELNYAEHALRVRDDRIAVIFRSESGEREAISYRILAETVGRARAGLIRLGVGCGDRVVALAQNRPETLILFLAAASLGAIFSSCSPEFGVGSILDRFRQIEPRVLLSVESYRYAGKVIDRRTELARVGAELPSLFATILLGEPEAALPPPSSFGPRVLSWQEFTCESAKLSFDAVPFEHPLWILYSSGTTGLPKAIVHGHGGILLEHYKALALHSDLGQKDRFFWYSTTGWMMWNYLISGLLVGATVILYDGSPGYPDLNALWKLAEEERITYFGTSAPYLLACRKRGIRPNQSYDLSRIRAVGSTGAPLPTEGFDWVYQNVGEDLLLASLSGGTDVCTAFVLSCPLLPVHSGEIQCAGLGARVASYDENGQEVRGQLGELVLTEALPSMPISFWNDPGDRRRTESYFSHFPGAWRHGDWVKTTDHGGFVIYGRSDSTLNRGGVRMGTSEFYRLVEALPEVLDSLVVDTGTLDGGAGAEGRLWLFLVLRSGRGLDSALKSKVRALIRDELSPRHVPDEIRAIDAVPRTVNGKKLEVPVKKILLGKAPEQVVSRDTLDDPAVLEVFAKIARGET